MLRYFSYCHGDGDEGFCLLGYNVPLSDETEGSEETSMGQVPCLKYFLNLKM
jgi:hypothetical protein